MKTRLRINIWIISIISCIITTLNFGQSIENSNKRESVRNLIRLSGALTVGQQLIDNVINTYKTTMPNIPASFWMDLKTESNLDKFTENLVDIYDRYLTEEDIKSIINFYSSPTGKKFVSVMPQIIQESMTEGQKWGQDIGVKMFKKLQEQGLK
ncbi:MAG: DUF2059 domain-containing protein [bacterium]